MVYSRTSDDRVLTFLHSGKLWHDALVLLDEQTGSLWSQATGDAIQGPLEGSRLGRVPSVLTTWQDWLAGHPDTLVLPSEHARRKLRMRLYPRSNGVLGILGTKNPEPRLPGKTLVVGFLDDGKPVAVALSLERVRQRARLELAGRSVIIEHEGGNGPTTVWESTGPPDWKKGGKLPASTMYWFVWSALHPESRIVEAERFPPSARQR